MDKPPVHHGDHPAKSAYVPLHADGDSGYRRMFPELPAAYFRPDLLDKVSEAMKMPPAKEEQANKRWGQSDDPPGVTEAENPSIPAAYTYFGQFIDHDLTFDVGSRLERSASDPGFGPVNFRTPRFDLDSLFGGGPEADPHLYEADGKSLLLSEDEGDLQRQKDDLAIIPDPRNDENALVAQIHLAVAHIHNALVEGSEEWSFDEAQRLTRWHYQWVVVHDFLERTVGKATYEDVLYGRRLVLFPWPYGQFIPVEFSGAAFRFGHSQVRSDYVVATGTDPRPIFGAAGLDLRGGQPIGERKVEWPLLVDGTKTPTFKIDTELSSTLFNLFGDDAPAANPPDLPPGVGRNLAARNLRRGVVLGLPSGEDVFDDVLARGLVSVDAYAATGETEPTAIKRVIRRAFWNETAGAPEITPLWGWCLAEAELASGGEHLGPVGGRIVAETIVGLLQADPRSFLRVAPGWAPEKADYTLGDLLSGVI